MLQIAPCRVHPLHTHAKRDVLTRPAAYDSPHLWACWSRSMSFDTRKTWPSSHQYPRPRGVAPPTGQETGWGLGNGSLECKTVHRKGPDTTTVVLMFVRCTRTHLSIHWHKLSVSIPHLPSSASGRVLTRNRRAFLIDREPAQYFRASHKHDTDSTIAIVTTDIPEPIETNDLGPHNMGSVHPFFHLSLPALLSPRISFFIVFMKDVCRHAREAQKRWCEPARNTKNK